MAWKKQNYAHSVQKLFITWSPMATHKYTIIQTYCSSNFFLEIQAYVYQYKCWCINALWQIEPCITRLIDWCLTPTYYHDNMILLHIYLCSPSCHMIIYFIKKYIKDSCVLKQHYIGDKYAITFMFSLKKYLGKVPFQQCIQPFTLLILFCASILKQNRIRFI